MKAVVLNSGIAKRMGDYCKENPKALLQLYNGETLLERQIRILAQCGIHDFVITTGPFSEQIKTVTKRFPKFRFEVVHNPEYASTNYIYSLFLAEKYCREEVLLLHGDLVFNQAIIKKMLENPEPCLCLCGREPIGPVKDFRCFLSKNEANGFLQKVSVEIVSPESFALQPVYKLSKDFMEQWLERIADYINSNQKNVYAEEALNEILASDGENGGKIRACFYDADFVKEIDTPADYERVGKEIQAFEHREQIRIVTKDYRSTLKEMISRERDFGGANSFRKPLFVCRKRYFEIWKEIYPEAVCFDAYHSNPNWEEIEAGAEYFVLQDCDALISIGGGSGIDVAKAVKSLLVTGKVAKTRSFRYCDIKHIAVPTTAGTGSESTKIAVFYRNGEKQALQHSALLPEAAILDAGFLETLPEEHRKATFLDALCQSMESLWAKGATKESRELARQSIQELWKYWEDYLKRGDGKEEVLKAANLSGQAIHISQTTAPHALSYGLTAYYGMPHGQAVATAMIFILEDMAKKSRKENFSKTKELEWLAKSLGAECIDRLSDVWEKFLRDLNLPKYSVLEEDIEKLAVGADPKRLENHPVELTSEDIRKLYEKIREFKR